VVDGQGEGTVVDDGNANNPHVPCDFAVSFYGFDKDQEAKITFTIHPPSSSERTVLLSETETISDDEAGGGQDEDAVFTYSGTDFGLDRFEHHEKQGYHVKLTIFSKGVPGGKKHKVFWLDCAAPKSDDKPSESAVAVSTSPVSDGGTLPLTGPQTAMIALLGAALLGAGTLLVLRRRRDKVTFVS